MTNYADTLMNGFITGVTNNITGVLNALKTIASLFPHSPVESGPLAEVNDTNMTDYGGSLMTALATGITDGTPAVSSALKAVSSDINSTVSSSSAGGSLNALSVTNTADSTLSALTTTATTAASALNALTQASLVAANTSTSSAIEQASAAANAGATAQQVTVNFHPNSIQLPEGVTPDSARAIAGAFGDEVAKRINRGAISAGIKPYSIYNNPNLNR
jgi:uncharacterized membrane protein